jgi:hypothetical protein
MVAVRMGDGDKSDARRLKVELAKLVYQLRARRMANWCVATRRILPERIACVAPPFLSLAIEVNLIEQIENHLRKSTPFS